MGEQAKQPNAAQTEQESLVDERQPWEQPKLERLHVSLNTANTGGSGSDAGGRTKSN